MGTCRIHHTIRPDSRHASIRRNHTSLNMYIDFSSLLALHCRAFCIPNILNSRSMVLVFLLVNLHNVQLLYTAYYIRHTKFYVGPVVVVAIYRVVYFFWLRRLDLFFLCFLCFLDFMFVLPPTLFRFLVCAACCFCCFSSFSTSAASLHAFL